MQLLSLEETGQSAKETHNHPQVASRSSHIRDHCGHDRERPLCYCALLACNSLTIIKVKVCMHCTPVLQVSRLTFPLISLICLYIQVYFEDKVSEFPSDLSHLTRYVAAALGYPCFCPQSGIVNFYNMESTLCAHTDHSEYDKRAPLISYRYAPNE